MSMVEELLGGQVGGSCTINISKICDEKQNSWKMAFQMVYSLWWECFVTL